MTPLVWLGFRSSPHSEQESIAVGVDLFAFLRLGCVLGQTNIWRHKNYITRVFSNQGSGVGVGVGVGSFWRDGRRCREAFRVGVRVVIRVRVGSFLRAEVKVSEFGLGGHHAYFVATSQNWQCCQFLRAVSSKAQRLVFPNENTNHFSLIYHLTLDGKWWNPLKKVIENTRPSASQTIPRMPEQGNLFSVNLGSHAVCEGSGNLLARGMTNKICIDSHRASFMANHFRLAAVC